MRNFSDPMAELRPKPNRAETLGPRDWWQILVRGFFFTGAVSSSTGAGLCPHPAVLLLFSVGAAGVESPTRATK